MQTSWLSEGAPKVILIAAKDIGFVTCQDQVQFFAKGYQNRCWPLLLLTFILFSGTLFGLG
jgi:hypothetical protein